MGGRERERERGACMNSYCYTLGEMCRADGQVYEIG